MPKKICVCWSLQQLLKIKYQEFKSLLNTNIIIYMETEGNKLSPKDPYKTPLQNSKSEYSTGFYMYLFWLVFYNQFHLVQKHVEAAYILGFHVSVPSSLKKAHNLE